MRIHPPRQERGVALEKARAELSHLRADGVVDA